MWHKHSDALGWSKGHEGKGYLLRNGVIRHWNVDPYNPEDHQTVHQRNLEISPIGLKFDVDPDGGIVTESPTPKVESIVAADPRLYDAGQRPEGEFDLGEPKPKQQPGPDYNFINSKWDFKESGAALDQHVVERLGPEALDPYEPADPKGAYPDLPRYVYRSMSEPHFQQSIQQGWHQSDERGNYIGQGVDDQPEGTVAGRWAYPGYLNNAEEGLGRIVKMRVHPDDGWENHPDDDEGGYVRTFNSIPTDRFEAWTDPIDWRQWQPVPRVGTKEPGLDYYFINSKWHFSDGPYGYTNWDTSEFILTTDNDRKLNEAIRKLVEQGAGPEEIRDWAIKNVIGPYNKEQMRQTQEWNEIPLDERKRRLRERDVGQFGEEAVNLGDSLMQPFEDWANEGKSPEEIERDEEYDEPDLIDPELVNWDEVRQEILDEFEENAEHDRSQQEREQRMQQQGLDFRGEWDDENEDHMVNAMYKHHGAKPESWFEQQGINRWDDPRWANNVVVRQPFEHLQQLQGYPDSFIHHTTRANIWSHQADQLKKRRFIELQMQHPDWDPQHLREIAEGYYRHAPLSEKDTPPNMNDSRIAEMVEKDPNIQEYKKNGYPQSLPEFTRDVVYAIQRGQEHPAIPMMQQALAQQGYTPEQITQYMQQKKRWDPEADQWMDLGGPPVDQWREENKNQQMLDQPGNFYLPSDWTSSTKESGSWDPTTCENCGAPMGEPRLMGSRWVNSCTHCRMTRDVPTSNPLLKQWNQNWPPYPDLLQEVAKPRAWVSSWNGSSPANELQEWLADMGEVDPPSIHHETDEDMALRPQVSPQEGLSYYPPGHVPDQYKQAHESFDERPYLPCPECGGPMEYSQDHALDYNMQGLPEHVYSCHDCGHEVDDLPFTGNPDIDHHMYRGVYSKQSDILQPQPVPQNPQVQQPPQGPRDVQETVHTQLQEALQRGDTEMAQWLMQFYSPHQQLMGFPPMMASKTADGDPIEDWESEGGTVGSTKTADSPQIMYHVAPAHARESIERKGLLPHHDPDVDSQAGVFLSANPSDVPQGHDVWEVNTNGLEVQPDPWGEHMTQEDWDRFVPEWQKDSWYHPEPIPPDRIKRIASHRTADSPINQADATNDPLGKPAVLEPSKKGDPDYLKDEACPHCQQVHRPDEPCPNSSVRQYQQQERKWYNYDPNVIHSKQAQSQVMYHVAPAEHEQTIATEGLQPNAPSGDYPQGVYLFPDRENAEFFADHMREHDLDEGSNNAERHVYEVNSEGLPLQQDPAVSDDDPFQAEYPTALRSYYTPEPIPSDRIRRVAKIAAEQGYWHVAPSDFRKQIQEEGLAPHSYMWDDEGLAHDYGHHYVMDSLIDDEDMNTFPPSGFDVWHVAPQGVNPVPDPEQDAEHAWLNYEGVDPQHLALVHHESRGRTSKTASKMYHVAPQSARESIEQHGIDWLRDPGYASTDLTHDDWNDVGEEYGQRGNYLSDVPDHPMFRNTPGLDTWEIETTGLNLHPDEAWAGGRFTPEPIPPDRIRRVE